MAEMGKLSKKAEASLAGMLSRACVAVGAEPGREAALRSWAEADALLQALALAPTGAQARAATAALGALAASLAADMGEAREVRAANVVKKLAQSGAVLDAPGARGMTPLGWAASSGLGRVCRALAKSGADCSRRSGPAMELPERMGPDPELSEWLAARRAEREASEAARPRAYWLLEVEATRADASPAGGAVYAFDLGEARAPRAVLGAPASGLLRAVGRDSDRAPMPWGELFATVARAWEGGGFSASAKPVGLSRSKFESAPTLACQRLAARSSKPVAERFSFDARRARDLGDELSLALGCCPWARLDLPKDSPAHKALALSGARARLSSQALSDADRQGLSELEAAARGALEAAAMRRDLPVAPASGAARAKAL